MIIDAPVAENAVEEAGGIEIAEKVPTEETYGIAVAKDNTELLEQINEGLAAVIEDGTYTKIYEKWFKEAPPKEIFAASTKRNDDCAGARTSCNEGGAGDGAPSS